jgi:hypothetical protein
MSEASRRFADAFNARRLEQLADLLSENATAEVLGSGFPVEFGRNQIRSTSLPHLLGDGNDPLVAEVWEEDHVLLREPAGRRRVDSAIRIQAQGRFILRLEYLVLGFRREELERICAAAGYELRAEPQ